MMPYEVPHNTLKTYIILPISGEEMQALFPKKIIYGAISRVL